MIPKPRSYLGEARKVASFRWVEHCLSSSPLWLQFMPFHLSSPVGSSCWMIKMDTLFQFLGCQAIILSFPFFC